MLLVTTDKQLVLVWEQHRIWLRIKCFCSTYRRKADGRCKHERALLAQLGPRDRARARVAA